MPGEEDSTGGVEAWGVAKQSCQHKSSLSRQNTFNSQTDLILQSGHLFTWIQGQVHD